MTGHISDSINRRMITGFMRGEVCDHPDCNRGPDAFRGGPRYTQLSWVIIDGKLLKLCEAHEYLWKELPLLTNTLSQPLTIK